MEEDSDLKTKENNEANEALEPMRMSASIIREELMEVLNTVLRMAQLER